MVDVKFVLNTYIYTLVCVTFNVISCLTCVLMSVCSLVGYGGSVLSAGGVGGWALVWVGKPRGVGRVWCRWRRRVCPHNCCSPKTVGDPPRYTMCAMMPLCANACIVPIAHRVLISDTGRNNVQTSPLHTM